MKLLSSKTKKQLSGLLVVSAALLNSCGTEDDNSSLDQISNEDTVVMGMSDSRSLWGRSGGLDDDFRNRMESQIKEVIMYGFADPMSMTLRDMNGVEGPLVKIESINISRGQTKTKTLSGSAVIYSGKNEFTVTDYDIDFDIRLQMPNGVTDIVSFTMSDLMHRVERAEVSGSILTPASTLVGDLGVPNFILSIVTQVTPNISGTQVVENHQPAEIEKDSNGVSLFQKGIFTNVLYPLCCTVSSNDCPELKKVHPLLAERKQALTAKGYTYHGIAPIGLTCDASSAFSTAIDESLAEMAKSRDWQKGASAKEQESFGFFERLWRWFTGASS